MSMFVELEGTWEESVVAYLIHHHVIRLERQKCLLRTSIRTSLTQPTLESRTSQMQETHVKA